MSGEPYNHCDDNDDDDDGSGSGCGSGRCGHRCKTIKERVAKRL